MGLILLLVVAAGAAWYVFRVRGVPYVAQGSVLVITLDGKVVDHSERPGWVRRLATGAAETSLLDLHAMLEKAAFDDRIRGLLLIVDNPGLGWGKAQELVEMLDRFKARGKEVVAYLESGELLDYAIAAGAAKIVVPQCGWLSFLGLRAEVTFLKDTLAKAGVEGDFVRFKDYKTAADALMRSEMSEAHREMLDAILDSHFASLRGHVAARRQLPLAAVDELIARGSFLPEEARQLGLVDRIAYLHELLEDWNDLAGAERALGKEARAGRRSEVRTVAADRYERVSARFAGVPKGPTVVVVAVHGPIASGESGRPTLLGRAVGARTVVRALRRARQDRRVRGIVLRVDSPGGSGVASDLIWAEVRRCLEDKPVVASMSDVAGSGGYYIAMAAKRIVAHSMTITGSIGVIGGKFAIPGMLDRLAANKVVISRGRYSQMYSSSRRFSDDERELVTRTIRSFYDSFVQKVGECRSMSAEDVDAVAGGRVWTGEQACARGLVDERGGLSKALDVLREEMRLPSEMPLRLAPFPPQMSPLRRLIAGQLGHDGLLAALGQAASEARSAMAVFRDGEALAIAEAVPVIPGRTP